MRCELYCSDCCSVFADCGILNDVIEFDVVNEATISAWQHSSNAAPMQLYFIIMVLVSYGVFSTLWLFLNTRHRHHAIKFVVHIMCTIPTLKAPITLERKSFPKKTSRLSSITNHNTSAL